MISESKFDINNSTSFIEDKIDWDNPSLDETIKQLKYPCLVNALIGVANAEHNARIAGCSRLKSLGYNPDYIFQWFKQRQYADVENEQMCKDQIKSIWHYKPTGCFKMKLNGYCVGKSCYWYKDESAGW